MFVQPTVFMLIFVALTTAFGRASANLLPNINAPGTPLPVKQIPDPVIKLAIFYDAGFASRFNNNVKKIVKYLEVIVYDLHLRFHTFGTSFRVTSLNLIKKVFCGLEELPAFDIIVHVRGRTSSNGNPRMQKILHGSICNLAVYDNDDAFAVNAEVLIQANPSPAGDLSIQIASILGAPSDNDPACGSHSGTKPLCCIMGGNKLSTAKFFSNCTKKQITNKLIQLNSDNEFCLDAAKAPAVSVIDSAQLFANPSQLQGYTIAEQCQILLNDGKTDFVAKTQKSDSCLRATCVDSLTYRKMLDFTPLEHSKCGETNEGRCLRGLCIQHKFQLVNVGTGKCLVSEKGIFGINDKPILQECSRVVTQMLIGPPIAQCCDYEELVLLIPYFVDYGTSMKRFSINLKTKKMTFCSRENSKTCRDTTVLIHKMDDFNEDFVLGVENGWYVKAAEDGINVGLTTDGTGRDRTTRWKLVELAKGAIEPFKNCNLECKPELVYSETSGFGAKTRIEL